MKTNRLYNLLLILALVAFVATVAARPMTQRLAVVIPDQIKDLLSMALVFVLTAVMRWIGGKLGIDLQDWSAIIAAGLVSAAVTFGNALLSAVPIEYEQLANSLLQTLVVLLGSMGVFTFAKHSKASAMKTLAKQPESNAFKE